ncbi:hypothetical protein BOV90_08055 [Solemya velum gill symbiont]|uniref:Uncharacterized protein n=1 Tax=Solemya velum gill symbiont TaxID=2340 RepID=A0A1T2NXP2_SOVGS|nr:hypothetical protein BOV88_04780 [Solemya velum gill symbiont]OOY38485.1 hypothetical protein BOV89_01390 [Solemya velum gill symbiont]OOY39694.1 hypothetical protein BOV90_08055 [Solemya velum gill symbiont]OOY42057.1 hypothetical protein BOV91_08240 [Solemya velum gill symbiont]OOY45631.1 hypothetical protein BOV92_04860 [Solemya velum gill symbiont]
MNFDLAARMRHFCVTNLRIKNAWSVLSASPEGVKRRDALNNSAAITCDSSLELTHSGGNLFVQT